ncbi:MAG: helix-turn-helix transcriptional regulator [Candidatus Methanofastidiosa archaeon]|nr:helix-turn-helix transcriptional regulator [Candidatus Methanofastidiosa archaeon]
METKIDFSAWLLQELEKREWTQAKLAEKAHVKKSTISRILRGERGIGNEVAISIAKALDYPQEKIFRLIGLLPTIKQKSEQKEELNFLFDKLPEKEKEDLLKYIRIKLMMIEDETKRA